MHDNLNYLNFDMNIMYGKERNALFNDALNTFHLRLYGVRYMVKDHVWEPMSIRM